MNVIRVSQKDNLSDILNSINCPATIYLEKGTYCVKAEIAADDITIIGEGRETTVITFGDYARKIHADGLEYNTFRTYTLCVTGNNVKLYNLTVENSNTNPGEVGQCVALSVHSKNFYAKDCDFKSTQDTLFLSPFPDDLVIRYRDFLPRRQLYSEGGNLHLFENCRIYGTVDYVFGCAEAYFRKCSFINIYDVRGIGFVAAPAHPLRESKGFTFIDCDFTDGGAGENSAYLARPWRDFGKCVFINCKIGKHIKSGLFDKWNDTERDKTARFLYYNLTCELTPAPVEWAKELTQVQANEIINYCNARFMKK